MVPAHGLPVVGAGKVEKVLRNYRDAIQSSNCRSAHRSGSSCADAAPRRRLVQEVIVPNVGGAGGAIGTARVAEAKSDG